VDTRPRVCDAPDGEGKMQPMSSDRPVLDQINLVRDMDAMVELYEARPPGTVRCHLGARYAIVTDPDGNSVGIMSPVDRERRSAPPTPPDDSV
jgi:hypothetical protein